MRRPALPLDQQQAGTDQLFQVKAEGRIRYAERLEQLGRRQPGVTTLDDEPEDVQPGLLPEGEEGSDGIGVVHISNYMEIL